MAMRYLGGQIDIHGGGRDLAFSHHESERAQSEFLTGCVPFARLWLHTGLVRFEGRKMSKSLGNLVDVGEALERVSPAAVRLYLVSHAYRRDWSFSWSGLERAERFVARLRRAQLQAGRLGAGAGPTSQTGIGAGDDNWAGEPTHADAALRADFKAALRADLDTPGALRVLRRALRLGEADAASWMLGILAGTAALG